MTRSLAAPLLWGAAIGGLIGLGGAEFRLPVLLGAFALAAHQAVRLNLLVSLVTLAASAVARFGFAAFPGLSAHWPEIAALTLAAVAAAWFGAGLLDRVDAARLTRVIAALLAGMDLLLLTEAAAGDALHLGAEPGGWWRAPAGALAGAAIGLVSSLLGVAGGELIIPTLVFGFGLDIRTAGTASLVVSLPAVALGVLRHGRAGGYRDRAVLGRVGVPMALGSVLGAGAGAALLPHAPVEALKLGLGAVLLASSAKLWRTGAEGGGGARRGGGRPLMDGATFRRRRPWPPGAPPASSRGAGGDRPSAAAPARAPAGIPTRSGRTRRTGGSLPRVPHPGRRARRRAHRAQPRQADGRDGCLVLPLLDGQGDRSAAGGGRPSS